MEQVSSSIAGLLVQHLLRVTRQGTRQAAAFTLLALGLLTAAQAAIVTLDVVAARTEAAAFGGVGVQKGDPVVEYKFILNVDNTGSTAQRSPAVGSGCSPQDAGYPGSCLWTSIAGAAGKSPVLTQGNQSDIATGIECRTAATWSRCWPKATNSTANTSRWRARPSS